MQQKTIEATAGNFPQRSTEQRISSMFSQDCAWASGLLIGLWLLYAFVFYEVWATSGDKVSLALLTSGGLVLLFNTASIVAMIRHYSNDKERIYGLDLHYLDIMRKAKR